MTVRLRRELASPAHAERVLRALGPDQAGFVEASRSGAVVEFVIRASTAGRARATADDLLACLGTAERAAVLTDVAADVAPTKGPAVPRAPGGSPPRGRRSRRRRS